MGADQPYRHRKEQGEVPEHLVAIRQEVLQALTNKPPRPVLVPTSHPEAFGDDFLRFYAHKVVVSKFCQQEAAKGTIFDFDPVDPPIRYFEPGQQNLGVSVWGKIFASISPFNSVMQETNRYSRNLRILGRLLGVELTDDELTALPLPIKTNYGPLKEFDAEKVQKRGVNLAISPERSGRKQIIIVQAGSSEWKRFNDDQITQLVQEAKAVDPNSYVTVVTDKVFDSQQNPNTIPSFGADHVVTTPDINEIGAHFAMNNPLIVTTDTFLAWYAAGCQGILPKNEGKLLPNTLINLFTVADPDHWHIPGMYEIESPAFSAARKEGYMSHDGFLIGAGETYRSYWIYGPDLKQIPNSTPNDKARALHGIAQGDIDLVKRAIRGIAGAPEQRRQAAS